MSTKSISEMVTALYEFADNPSKLILREFIAEQRMSQLKFAELLKKNPELEEAFHYARLRVGIRRENAALDDLMNIAVYKESSPLYDDELKKLMFELKRNTLTIDDAVSKLNIVLAKAEEVTE